MQEIREATDDDREGLAAVLGLSFNYQPGPEEVTVAGSLCAFEGKRLVGTAKVIPFGQWFGGRRVPCAGVAGVAVLPEQRGRGLATRLVQGLLALRRREGDALSVLYPANSELYHRLGYEFAGLRPRFTASLADLPPGKGEVEVIDPADPAQTAPVMACFSRYAAQHNGPVESADPTYWASKVLAHAGEGTHPRTVVVPGASGLEGYASYYTAEEAEPRGLTVTCKHLVAHSAGALTSLLGYLRRFENLARYVGWAGPAGASPVGLAASSNAFSIVPRLSRWMGRVLDVPRALEARGYPAGLEAEVAFSVEDPFFPANAGPWQLRVSGGRGHVQPLPSAGEALPGGTAPAVGRPLPVGRFSALYSGLASPADLVAVGALAGDDPRLGLLANIFTGPVPWMPDFF